MIGGIDLELPTWAGDSTLERAVEATRQLWPDAVFQEVLTGDRYDTFDQMPFGGKRQIFVYRDVKAADRWEAMGAVPSLYNTMVHLITDPGFITIVVDEENEFTRQMINAISTALRDDLFCAVALAEAA
ncbi:MAG TPA: hypothetical protein VHX65_19115 [Pirellulales bacterium]|jgi:hypothetical protein|nr:hypothetical protein [Pirellulales bacterium]